jgi:hypothetical protein
MREKRKKKDGRVRNLGGEVPIDKGGESQARSACHRYFPGGGLTPGMR